MSPASLTSRAIRTRLFRSSFSSMRETCALTGDDAPEQHGLAGRDGSHLRHAILRAEPFGCRDSIHPEHADVHERDIGLLSDDCVDGLAPVRGLAQDRDVVGTGEQHGQRSRAANRRRAAPQRSNRSNSVARGPRSPYRAVASMAARLRLRADMRVLPTLRIVPLGGDRGQGGRADPGISGGPPTVQWSRCSSTDRGQHVLGGHRPRHRRPDRGHDRSRHPAPREHEAARRVELLPAQVAALAAQTRAPRRSLVSSRASFITLSYEL